ncbi:hypothetical protein O9H85_09375 [Paenibacillus filicis]|uniref:Uncharacterized protein n=1 Tax=Paenibacillus gyeongsangnamensis TaxID=3388067 RepID=A0ABT4Q6X2_9BACL|nr:hypothetical protein [Paenibacillus filicis]MCZ8512619.1 hypothetical protein [Paenibacillus filicis]
MERGAANFRMIWFGYKKSQVRSTIRRLKQLQDSELQALHDQAVQLRMERQRLLAQRDKLLQERSRHNDRDLQELAYQRLPNAIEAMLQGALQESQSMVSPSFTASSAPQHELVTEEQAYEQMSAGIEAAGLEEQPPVNELRQASDMPVADLTLQQQEIAAQANNVVPFPAKALGDAYASLLTTADGLTLETTAQEKPFVSAGTNYFFGDKPVPASKAVEMPAAAFEVQAKENPYQGGAGGNSQPTGEGGRSHFWGEIDDFVAAAPAFEPSSAHEYAAPADPDQVRAEARADDEPKEKREEVQESLSGTEARPSADIHSHAEGGSKAIDSEIMAIRYRYIVGKIVGEDLFGRDGRKIAGRGEKITPELVERAERNGLLVELIVQMTIPGLGDA